MKGASPLRYPGGKWRVAPFFERLLDLNDLSGCRYVEPYAGGGSLALSLLFRNVVSDIYLNDLDTAIFSVWNSMLWHTDDFIRLIETTPLTVAEWRRQKAIYASSSHLGDLELGFATFYLNRTNHSGIFNGGPIGGQKQNGQWLIDARFNRTDLVNRVSRVHAARGKIHLSRMDAADFLAQHKFDSRTFLYLDPPYYVPGRDLYLNAYGHEAHLEVRAKVRRLRCPWAVSYDDVPAVRSMYQGVRSRRLRLFHSARNSRVGNEVVFFSDRLRIPRL